jgi:hypothetical protein
MIQDKFGRTLFWSLLQGPCRGIPVVKTVVEWYKKMFHLSS